MNWIVAIDHEDGSEAGYLAIDSIVGFRRNQHLERAYRTDQEDAEDLASSFNDHYHTKGYRLKAKAIRFVEVPS